MNINSLLNKEFLKKCIVPAVFIIYFIAGLLAYDDYGVSTDESAHRRISTYYLLYGINHIAGLLHADSVTEKIQKSVKPDFFQDYSDSVSGEAFGVPLLIMEAVGFGIKKQPTKEIYEFRHLMTFLFNFMGMIFFYLLIRNITGRSTVALLTTIMYMLSPRFFAESFYNAQDTVFLTSCIMAAFFYVRFLKNKTMKNGILLGLFAAFATGIRLLGIQFIMLAFFFVFLGFIKERKIEKNTAVSAGAMLLSFIVFVIILYPPSWPSPINHFRHLAATMTAFPKISTLLFMGQWIRYDSLPWYYIPVWMFITIPVLYILFFLHGLYIAAKQLLNRKLLKGFSSDYQVLLSLIMMFFVPLLGIISRHPILYCGWRHMYFLYLPLLAIAAYSISSVLTAMVDRKKIIIISTALGLYLFSVLVWMIVNHPYQYAFFNSIPGNIETDYEKDYWAVSMVDGMKYVVATDPSEKIIIKRSRGTAKHSAYMLPKDDRKRIEVMPDNTPTPENFNYFFYNGDKYQMRNFAKDKNLKEVHSICVYNSIYTQKFKIMSIYKK